MDRLRRLISEVGGRISDHDDHGRVTCLALRADEGFLMNDGRWRRQFELRVRVGNGGLSHGRARWPQRAAWLDGVLGLPNRSRNSFYLTDK